MTVTVEEVRRVRIGIEPAGAFGTELVIGDMVNLDPVEGTHKVAFAQPTETPGLPQQNVYGMNSKVFLPKKGSTYAFDQNLRALAARATGLAVGHSQIDLLEIAMGGKFTGTGSTVASGGTKTSAVLVSAAGFREGGVIAFATGLGGMLEARVIKTISSNTVTWKYELTAAPANAAVAYGGVTTYLDYLDGSNVKSLQAAIEGLGTTDRFLLKGGQINSPPGLGIDPGTVPKINWEWIFAQWLYANAGGAPNGTTTMNLNSALTDQDLSDVGINAVMDSDFRIFSHGVVTLAGTFVDAPQIKINPNIAFGTHDTPGGINTIKQFVALRVDGPPVSGEFVVPHESLAWHNHRTAEDALALQYQIGTSPAGGGVLIDVPHIVIDSVQRENLNGLACQRVKWFARLDNQTSANSTSIQKSPLRFHFI